MTTRTSLLLSKSPLAMRPWCASKGQSGHVRGSSQDLATEAYPTPKHVNFEVGQE